VGWEWDDGIETSLHCHRAGGIGGILESSIMLTGDAEWEW